MNGLAWFLVENILAKILKGEEWKSAGGLWSVLLGVILWVSQKAGYAPTTVDGTLGQVLDYVWQALTTGGGLLASYGLGDKAGRAGGKAI